jgi:UrcA family protein
MENQTGEESFFTVTDSIRTGAPAKSTRSETMTFRIHSALLAASALGLLISAVPAAAQGYDDQYGYRTGPNEEVIVVAPDYYYHRPYPSNQLGRPPEPTTLSLPVNYGDLDLSTRAGAHELRARVRDAAHDICSELASRYPIRMANSAPCYEKAVESGLNRAESAIHEARYEYRDGY